MLGLQRQCVVCNLHNAQHPGVLLCRVWLAQLPTSVPLQPSTCMWLTAALQVLAVSTHNHYRRVQDRMRKKQQQEARETAAASAGKMQAPAGPSGQAQVGCASVRATRRWAAGHTSAAVQDLAGELDMLHPHSSRSLPGSCVACGTLRQGRGPAGSFTAQRLCCVKAQQPHALCRAVAAPCWLQTGHLAGLCTP